MAIVRRIARPVQPVSYKRELLTWAHKYAKDGYSVFPVLVSLKDDGKKDPKFPTNPTWPTASTTDLRQVDEWFGPDGSWEGTGIAVDCGKSGIVVVDLDGPEGLESWEKLLAEHGDTDNGVPRVRTRSGGAHLYFRQRDDAPINSKASVVAPHVDTRGVGGLVFAAPTRVSDEQSYTWSTDLPRVEDLPLVPAWLPPLAAKKPEKKPTAPVWRPDVPRQRVTASRDLHPVLADAEGPRGLLRYLDGKARQVEDLPVGAPGESPCNEVAFEFSHYIASGELSPETVRARLYAAVATWQDGWDRGHAGIEHGLRNAEEAEPRHWSDCDDDESFWSARPILAHIHNAGYAGIAAPWAVFGALLVETLAGVPNSVVLPGVGDRLIGTASLNTYVAVVGKSGAGKNLGEMAARGSFEFEGGQSYGRRELGTGQGITGQYVRPRKRGKGDEDLPGRITDSMLFTLDEIDSLNAHGRNQGATVLSTLASAWSGKPLGAAYADMTKDRPLEADSYRMTLLANVQPERSGVLVHAEGSGLPQRFLWLPAIDPKIMNMSETQSPGILHVTFPAAIRKATAPVDSPYQEFPDLPDVEVKAPQIVMDVCPRAREEVREARIRAASGQGGDPLDSHALLVRLKVAACLAIWEGRLTIDDEDWRLSKVVMRVSKETRAECLRGVQAAATKSHAKRTMAVREAESMADDRDHASVRERIMTVVSAEWKNASWVRNQITGKKRHYVDEILEELVEGGVFEMSEAPNRNGQAGYRVRQPVVNAA